MRGQLSTADARRETVLRSAAQVFALRGLYGTPTLEIATAAGISHAYLFRLFPTKLALFIAVVEDSNDRIHHTLAEAAATARRSGADVLAAMSDAYLGLLADRNLLLIQLHAHAASENAVVRTHMRRACARLVDLIERESAASPEQLRHVRAEGVLLNVLSAMHAETHDGHWAQLLLTRPDAPLNEQAVRRPKST